MSINVSLLLIAGVLLAAGVYLLLERSLTRVLLGLVLLGNGFNALLFFTAGKAGLPGFSDLSGNPRDYTDPLPQALILTAIVISFAVSAFMLGIIYRSWWLARQDEIEDDAEDRRVSESPTWDAEDDEALPQETSEFATSDEVASDDDGGLAPDPDSPTPAAARRKREAERRRADARAKAAGKGEIW